MKNWVAHHFSAVMVLAVIFGLFMPGLEYLPIPTALVLISVAIFFSCSLVTMADLKQINLREALIFYIVRFLILPVPLYFLTLAIVPEYALGVLLIALAPVGASSTTISTLMKANSSFCLSATIITNALAPFVMPIYIFYLDGSEANIDPLVIFTSLSLSIFVPAFVYFAIVRRFDKAKLWVKQESEFYSTLCIGAMIAVVIAFEKDYIFENFDAVAFMTLLGGILYIVYYAVAWLYGRNMSWQDRKTYMLCSAVNNTGMCCAIAVLYFSPVTILFTVLVEIPWIIALVTFKKYAKKHDGLTLEVRI